MRVGLVYPFTDNSDLQIPLGIGYLASYLQERMEDVDVRAMDTGIMSPREIAKFLQQEFDLLGFSVSSRSYRESVRIMRIYKDLYPNTPIVYGGPHVSMVKAAALEREPMIDYIVIGEGEITFHELVSLIREKGECTEPDALGRIDGLIWRRGEEIIVNRSRQQIIDLDQIPYPAFDLFPVRRYPSQYPLTTSRGCPFSCTFCTVVSLWGSRKYRVHSPKRIVDEIEYRVNTYGSRPVLIHDDAFNIRLERMNDICREMLRRNVRIPFGVRGFRVDILNKASAELLREAGCTNVGIGIECANNDMLKRIKKCTTVEVMDKGITMLRRVGIHVGGQFMIGNPGETNDTVRDSLEFARNTDLSSSTFTMAIPFPGTPLWEYANRHGRFLVEKDVTNFDDVPGKIIFETPEFDRDGRIKARELAREAGFLSIRIKEERKTFSKWVKYLLRNIWLSQVYPHLPRYLSWHIYFALRDLTKGSRVTHTLSIWARSRGLTRQETRMKGRGNTIISSQIITQKKV